VALWLFALAPAPLAAEEGFTFALSHDIMSPFCPGRTLASCPSPQAKELVVWIQTQEAAGASRSEVEAILYERYGDQILAAPRNEGVQGLTAYALPTLILIVGALAAGFAVWRLGRKQGAVPDTALAPTPVTPTGGGPAIDADLAAQVDRELEELDA